MDEHMKVHYSAISNEWETPQDLFDKLHEEFHFTLDPCCTKETAKCSKFFTEKENGLLQSWENEVVFMNPPYGRKIGKWIEKAFIEGALNGGVVVCLIPARTDTLYWHNYIFNHAEIRFIKGRVKFVKDGSKPAPAPFPSAIVIYNGKNKRQEFV